MAPLCVFFGSALTDCEWHRDGKQRIIGDREKRHGRWRGGGLDGSKTGEKQEKARQARRNRKFLLHGGGIYVKITFGIVKSRNRLCKKENESLCGIGRDTKIQIREDTRKAYGTNEFY